MSAALDLAAIDGLTGGRMGTHDVACPMCGPDRHDPANRVREVLRVWRVAPGFASWHCARCGESGHTRARNAPRPDPAKVAAARREAAERERAGNVERINKARWLWSQRRAIRGSPAETYLREARDYAGPLPATLGFLPARGEHVHAMIAALGLPSEPEPGVLAIADDAVRAVHITKLAPDGRGKASVEKPKIVVASPIADRRSHSRRRTTCSGSRSREGIEDALSVHRGDRPRRVGRGFGRHTCRRSPTSCPAASSA